jgi:ribosomal protein S18 acetylase RimI-like enzyme
MNALSGLDIVRADGTHRAWLDDLIREEWAGPMIASKGKLTDTSRCPGFVAVDGREPLGGATYHITDGDCEVISLNSLYSGQGIGSALLQAVREVAELQGCRRLWLVTTNDNTHAIRFYQKYGFFLCAVHLNALEKSRALKPSIPKIGLDGIPLLHELEFEILLRRPV